MPEKSTKPYLIRAIHEWCCDSNLTPYLSVRVDENTRVPQEHVKNGEIVLNVSYDATHRLTIGNEAVQFSARFGGVSRECSVPLDAVLGIFAKENGQGLFFEVGTPVQPAAAESDEPPGDNSPPPPPTRPKLQIVK